MIIPRLAYTYTKPDPLQIKPEVLIQKIVLGLARWAKAKMGKDFDEYLKRARADFLLRVHKKAKDGNSVENWIRLCVLNEPITFPLRLRKKEKLEFYKLAPQIRTEYYGLLKNIQRIKKKKVRFSDANLRLSLKETLVGLWVTDKKIRDYCGMKASAVAFDYLARKYKLGSGEALKKSLSLATGIGQGLSELDKWLDSSEEKTILGQMYYGLRFPRRERIEYELVKAAIKVSAREPRLVL